MKLTILNDFVFYKSQIRPDILSAVTWVQTVCKGYQQTTLTGKEMQRHLDRSN